MSEEENLEEHIEGDIDKRKHSLWTYISYNFMGIIFTISWIPLTTYYLFFYQVVIGMNVFLIALGFVIFSIWDAFNDPFMGFLSDKPTRFTKRWGRRFPFILVGALPILITFVLIWTPPTGNEIITFIYFLIILLIHETFYTMVGTPWSALFPEKFNTDKDRRTNSAVSAFTIFLAYAIATLVPPMFIDEYDGSTYFIMSLVILFIGIGITLIGIWGCREDASIITRALDSFENQERISFFKSLGIGLKNRNFLAYAIIGITSQAAFGVLLSTLVYWIVFVLGLGIEFAGIFTILYFVATIVSMPVWYLLMKKLGNKTTFLIGLGNTVVGFFLILFAGDMIIAIVFVFVLGFAQGSSTFVGGPIFGDVIDDITLKTKIPREGIYSGIQAFINRFGVLIAPVIIAIVLTLTGFDENLPTQSPEAQMGIRALVSWIPSIIILISVVLFYFLYKLNSEVTKETKQKLRELKL